MKCTHRFTMAYSYMLNGDFSTQIHIAVVSRTHTLIYIYKNIHIRTYLYINTCADGGIFIWATRTYVWRHCAAPCVSFLCTHISLNRPSPTHTHIPHTKPVSNIHTLTHQPLTYSHIHTSSTHSLLHTHNTTQQPLPSSEPDDLSDGLHDSYTRSDGLHDSYTRSNEAHHSNSVQSLRPSTPVVHTPPTRATRAPVFTATSSASSGPQRRSQ